MIKVIFETIEYECIVFYANYGNGMGMDNYHSYRDTAIWRKEDS
jgi:hypothetical protein